MTTTRQNSINLQFASDIRGNNTFAPGFPLIGFSVQLLATSATTFTVPSSHNTWILSFSYMPEYGIWVARNATAAAPGTNNFLATTSIFNPSPRTVYAGDVISVYSRGAIPDLGVELYAISG